MIGQGWLLGLIAVIIFAIFVVGILVMIHHILKKAERLMEEVEIRLRTLDPIFKIVNEVGVVVERHADSVRRLSEVTDELLQERGRETCAPGKTQVIGDLLQWALIGVSVWQKFKNKR